MSDFLLCFYHDPLRNLIKINVNKFAISQHMAFKLIIEALTNYLELPYQCWLHNLPDTKVQAIILVKTT